MIGAYLIQLLANAGLTAAVVYIPLWAKNFNATHSQIGLLVALYQGMMFFSNLLCGRWADFGDRKRFVVFGLNLSAFALFLHLLPHSLFGLFSIRALTGICAGIFPAALVAYFYTENRNLGRFSGFGSLGWGIGAIMVGFLNNRHLFLTSGLLMLFTALLAWHLLKKQPVTLKQSFFNTSVFKRNWRVYLSFLLRHLGAFSIWTIFPLYLAHLGANQLWVGLIYAINPLAQFLFMNILQPVNDTRLIRIGLLLSVIVFIAFGLATRVEQVIPIQLALALSWSCLYLGTLKQLLRRNEEKSTASGILQSVLSLAAVLGALLEGVTGAFGYRTIMLVAAGVAVSGALLYLITPEKETA
uniref:MFS transporter n=1 Tax=candidate division WOR-3 bacterium TaxID=2052148 RepID=A0A7V3UZ85_UNCW3